MKRAVFGILAVVFLIAVTYLGLSGGGREAKTASEVAARATPLAARAKPSVAKPPSVAQLAAATPDGILPANVKLSPESHARLNEFARLELKAFLTDEEKAARASALKDDAFLREIGRVLVSRGLDETTKRDQYQAIDALLSAQSEGSKSASEILASVVADAQVEDPKIGKEVRQNLAGIKAELLYKWTAQDASAQVEDLLPGPVSRQLWSNVQDSQSRNEAESQTLDH